jgi:prepilin-type N-terminal cleavage/methylation domain-containing protein
MREDGVTLAELLVTVSVVGILALVLGFSFRGWMVNFKIENQTKELYSDLMDARTKAMTRNRMHFIVLNTNNYAVYEDTNDNNAANPGTGDNPTSEYKDAATSLLKTKPLQYNLGWTGRIMFDRRGLSDSATAIPVRLNLPSGATPDFDCIIVYQSRIRMGKYNETTSTCDEK